MKTENLQLSQLKVNVSNPRTITSKKLDLLVERLLAFPKMIEIRPIVVDKTMTALGGNMRLRAFERISKMGIEEIATILGKTKNFQRLTKAEKENILAYWGGWIENPVVACVKASTLTESEKKEFVIADNASFGEWDYDKLANEWENDDLVSWGVDVWEPEPFKFGDGGTSGDAIDTTALPPELQGVDINPDELPKIEGSDETLMERVIIVYPKEREAEMASKLGLEKIDKVLYNIDEIGLLA